MQERIESLNVDIPDSVLLKHAVFDLKNARVKIGQLESYIEELEHELKSLRHLSKNHITLEAYTSMNVKKNKQIKNLEAKNEALKKQIYDLNYKLAQCQNKK